ncbi:MAG: HdeD family acid-resistance protein [Candidatus Binataceae bacterium]
MLTRLVQHWWVFVLRGVVAIIFGISAFAWPGLTIATLILLFGAYALVDGAFLIISAISGWGHIEDPWLILLEGLLGIGIGVVTFHAPTVTILGLLIYIAAWSLATGVLEIASAMRLRKELAGEFWLLLSGILSIAFAVVLMWYPAAGAVALVWIIGAYAIGFGIVLIALGLKLNRVKGKAAAA